MAISLMVRTEQGATIMPRVGNEPEAIAAPTSPTRWTTSALAVTAARSSAVSSARVRAAARETTRWVATPSSRQASSTRTPSIAPDAPEMPTTSGGVAFSLICAAPSPNVRRRPHCRRHIAQPYVI